MFKSLLDREARVRDVKVVHIPNEGRRSRRQGASLKGQGLRPGAPDLLVWLHGAGTLSVELKIEGSGRLSKEQSAFGRSLVKLKGHEYIVVFASNVTEACKIVHDKIDFLLGYQGDNA